MGVRSRSAGALAAATVGVLALVGCADPGPDLGVFQPGEKPPDSPPPPAVTLAVAPAPGTDDAPLSTEIGTETEGDITEVTLITADGDEVEGDLRADGTSWVPAAPLAPSTEYTATVTATGAGGDTVTEETHFTTMAAPGARTGTGLYLFDGNTYGVAMPVVVEFVQGVPEDARAEVERRMFVASDPPQPGVWHWVEDGRQAYYRSREYWQPGTTLDVRIALDGHPTGEGRYGDQDRSASVTIGRRFEMKVDDASKEMTVYEDEELVKTFPVSLGKPSTPSSYGTMVVMAKEEQTVFDTYDELGPDDGYRTDISYAMRLTWGGEYIHAAPWSVGDQGVRNVSHGCVNLSMGNAEWLYHNSLVGDPVTVRGTERPLAPGNGWTAWDLTWDEFVAGSALGEPDLDVTG